MMRVRRASAVRERRSLYALYAGYLSKVRIAHLLVTSINADHHTNRSIVRVPRMSARQPSLVLAREQYSGLCGRMRVFV